MGGGEGEIDYHFKAGDKALDKIREKAFDRDLPVWGKLRKDGLFKQIPKEYWEHHGFFPVSFLKNAPEDFSSHKDIFAIDIRDSDQIIYKALKTSIEKVEELWPVESI